MSHTMANIDHTHVVEGWEEEQKEMNNPRVQQTDLSLSLSLSLPLSLSLLSLSLSLSLSLL